MKKLIFMFALAIAITAANAQDSKPKPKAKQEGQNNRKYKSVDEKVTNQTNKLKTELGLDDKQTEQVRALVLNKINQIEVVRKKNPEDKKAINEVRKAAVATFETELKGVLTEEQFSKYLAKKEEKKNTKGAKKEGAKKVPGTKETESNDEEDED